MEGYSKYRTPGRADHLPIRRYVIQPRSGIRQKADYFPSGHRYRFTPARSRWHLRILLSRQRPGVSSVSAHGNAMSRYYAWHSRIYDATRWAFLFGRDAILDDLGLEAGQTVVEIGCGTGRNFD